MRSFSLFGRYWNVKFNTKRFAVKLFYTLIKINRFCRKTLQFITLITRSLKFLNLLLFHWCKLPSGKTIIATGFAVRPPLVARGLLCSKWRNLLCDSEQRIIAMHGKKVSFFHFDENCNHKFSFFRLFTSRSQFYKFS